MSEMFYEMKCWEQNQEQEIKDLWHIWSVYLSISFAKVRERMLSGADAGADAGADREWIGRGFLSLWLAYRGHMTNGSG